MKIDNFALSNFQECPAKFQLRIKEHWQRSRVESGALIYGQALHSGLAAWYKGQMDGLLPASRREAAIEAVKALYETEEPPADDFRNVGKAVELIKKYIEEYPQESWKPVLVETSFSFELGRYILRCCVCSHISPARQDYGKRHQDGNIVFEPTNICLACGAELEPIEYGGIFDTLVEMGGLRPMMFILEHKTTSQLGTTYFHQYSINNQVTGYVWGAQNLSGKRVGGAMINALCTTSAGNIKFARQLTNRNDDDIEAWKDDVAASCNMIREAEVAGFYPRFTGSCSGKYGLCPYFNVHVLTTPDEQRRRLELDYEQKQWDFEARDV